MAHQKEGATRLVYLLARFPRASKENFVKAAKMHKKIFQIKKWIKSVEKKCAMPPPPKTAVFSNVLILRLKIMHSLVVCINKQNTGKFNFYNAK